MARREFSKAIKVEIIKRATLELEHGWVGIFCEKCALSTVKFEIDHRDPDAMQIDKTRKLTAADGWLLCIPCHAEKTKKDVADISKAKRREAKHLGADTPKAKIAADPDGLKSKRRPAHEGRESLPPRSIYGEA